jgi:hypothetical protein
MPRSVASLRLCDKLRSWFISLGPELPARQAAASGTHRPATGQEKNNASGFCLPKYHGLVGKLAVAAIVAAPLCLTALPAQAASEHPLRDMTQDIVSFLGFGPNQADNPTDPVVERPRIEVTPSDIAAPVAAVDTRPPHLPVVAAMTPTVERPLRRLFCVEYARMRSGLAVFGDAKHWWERAKNLYARLPHPVEEAVMVFSGSKRLKRGHVAVVTEIVGPRQIVVDQANWQNKGEIDHATPVLDVSAKNDWSKVRVWDIRSGTFGSHIYAISGFIAKELRTASRY